MKKWIGSTPKQMSFWSIPLSLGALVWRVPEEAPTWVGTIRAVLSPASLSRSRSTRSTGFLSSFLASYPTPSSTSTFSNMGPTSWSPISRYGNYRICTSFICFGNLMAPHRGGPFQTPERPYRRELRTPSSVYWLGGPWTSPRFNSRFNYESLSKPEWFKRGVRLFFNF